jgi:hypothetical protein
VAFWGEVLGGCGCWERCVKSLYLLDLFYLLLFFPSLALLSLGFPYLYMFGGGEAYTGSKS